MDGNLVPFPRFFGHVPLGSHCADNPTMIVVTHLIIRFSGRVKNLTFNTGFDRLFRVSNSEKYTAISIGRVFVFEFENKVPKFFLAD